VDQQNSPLIVDPPDRMRKSKESCKPEIVEFFAESTHVTITPNFKCNVLTFISGDYGPFRPQMPVVGVLACLNLMIRLPNCFPASCLLLAKT
jgi:hypothetical protein